MTSDDSTITGDVHGIPVARWENRPGYLQLSKSVEAPALSPSRNCEDPEDESWTQKLGLVRMLSQTMNMNPFPLILKYIERSRNHGFSRGYKHI